MTEHEIVDPAVDAATSAALREAFDVVSFARAVDSVTSSDLPDLPHAADAGWPTDQVTARRRRRSLWMAGSAAAAVAAVTAAFVLLPGGSSTAWAATPTPVSAADQQLASTACSASLADLRRPPSPGATGAQGGASVSSGGSGSSPVPVQGGGPVTGSSTGGTVVSGSVTVSGDGTAPAAGTAASPADLPAVPTTLPPLVALDRRGDRALAVFEDDGSSVACLLHVDEGGWSADGLMVGILDKGSGLAVAQMGMASASASNGEATGTPSNVVAGTVGKDVARVTLTFTNGTVAEATVAHGVYAAWFPGDFGTAPPIITLYDAQGHVR